MILLWIALGSLAAAAWTIYATEPRLTPDGGFYLLAGRGLATPNRYCQRWALPVLCGDDEGLWRILSWATLALCPLLLAGLLLANGLPDSRVAFGAALLVGLPLWHFGFEAPVLTDQTALCLTLLSALAAAVGHPWLAAGIALAGANVHETVPLWAAVTAWSVWPLTGLAAALACWVLLRPGPIPVAAGERRTWVIKHPFRAARIERQKNGWNFMQLVAPWGAVAALLPFAALTLQVGTALGLGYAQLLTGTDAVRFYLRAAPVAIMAAVTVPPENCLAAIALAHLFNPMRGDGL